MHTGGGLVLLKEFLDSWPSGEGIIAFLDQRAKSSLVLPKSLERIYWVKPSLCSRLWGEIELWRLGNAVKLVLCFNGLPPLFATKATVFACLQNKHYLGGELTVDFSWMVTSRLVIEKWIFRTFRNRISRYFVQTQTMRHAFFEWCRKYEIRKLPDCIVFPFSKSIAANISLGVKKWDFVYPSDGVAHKNHINLFKAWEILAKEGIFPSLVITLSNRDGDVEMNMKECCDKSNVKIENVGYLTHDGAIELCGQAGALIFPSLTESFGLPLVEASQMNLPILAPELDYVRDVCRPVQTFDPLSPMSIARAVKRYIGHHDEVIHIHTAKDFISEMLNGNPSFQKK